MAEKGSLREGAGAEGDWGRVRDNEVRWYWKLRRLLPPLRGPPPSRREAIERSLHYCRFRICFTNALGYAHAPCRQCHQLKKKLLFNWRNMDVIVGTGVLDCPIRMKYLYKIMLSNIWNSTYLQYRFFIYSRTVEDACPYNRICILSIDRTLFLNQFYISP